MPNLLRRRSIVVCFAVLVVGLLASGCDWSMFGYNSALTHFTPDNGINSGNVSTLKQLLISPTVSGGNGGFGSAAVSNGVVYVGDANGTLFAFDANGVTNCSGSPNECQPLWTSTLNGPIEGAPAVANGIVYVNTEADEVYAFDANGVTDCSGTPKVCQPLRTYGGGGGLSSPNVANGILYIGAGDLEAFDANGVTNCSGSPTVCLPLWQSEGDTIDSTPAEANGIVYATSGDRLLTFDANGVTNCSGIPKYCSPLWTGPLGTSSYSEASPAVSNGVVYAESNDDELYAFDANGVTSCSGVPKVCSPLWTATLSGSPGYSSPAVANGILYAPSGNLEAFSAAGTTNCSGTPKVCSPLWSYDVGVIGSSPSVANGLVYVGSTLGVEAFDSNGSIDCSGTPKVCSPLWTGTTGMPTPVTASPAIANGKVYAGDGFPIPFVDFNFYAWGLP